MDGRISKMVRCAGLGAMLALLLAPAAASAVPAVRLASPTSTNTTGDCLETACRLDRAIAVARSGDEVALQAGDYTVKTAIRASVPVTVRPAVATERPRLVAAAALTVPTLELAAGGVVRGLDIQAGSGIALQLAAGARGIGLKLGAGSSAAGGAKLLSAPSTTALISSVVHVAGGASAVEMVDPATGAGYASLVNVTAVHTGGSSEGVLTDMFAQSPVLQNVIVRAGSKDLHGRSGSDPILISSSNYRSSGSANFLDQGSNQVDVAVAFVDEAAGDLRLAPGAAPIDAGAAAPLSTDTTDPAGNARLFGLAPDIGAYEYGSSPPTEPTESGEGGTESGTGETPESGTGETPDTGTAPKTDKPADTGDTGSDGGASDQPVTPGQAPGATRDPGAPAGAAPLPLPAVSPPVLAERVAVQPAAGRLLVRLPGSTRFVPLAAAASVPVGSTVDARAGRVDLTSVRDARGRTQTGQFWGGVFVVRQSEGRTPYTDLVLSGGSFAGCPSARARAAGAGSGPVAYAAGGKRRRKRVVRKLWGSDDNGRFRTRGRSSVATVRGTVWLVQDRCDGTRTVVKEGAVSVRPRRGGRAVVVKAGRSRLVRAR